jgi:hypothetical protein
VAESTRSVSFLPLVTCVAREEPGLQRHTATAAISTSEHAMTRSPRLFRHWHRRPHRHTWLADTRDPDYSTARLMSGYAHQS